MTILPGVTASGVDLAVRAPRVTRTVLGGLAVLLSLLPSLLPRPAFVQGLLTGLLLVTAMGVESGLTRLDRRWLRPASPHSRWLVLGVCGLVFVAALYAADQALATSEAAVGLMPSGDSYWLVAGGVAVLVGLVLVGSARALRLVFRKLRNRRTQAYVVVVVALLAVPGPTAADAGWKAMAEARDIPYVLTEPSPVAGSVRTYVGMDEAATPEGRADLAVDRVAAAGGFQRSSVVLAIPTGTGWVNPFAVRAFERGLDGDLATVAMQAGYAPSWVEMFFGRADQEASARALYEAVTGRLARMPASDRPALYLYGESLGALVGQSIADDAAPVQAQLCGVVWAGVPGDVTLGTAHEVVHRNSDDPVVNWRPGLIVDRPDDWPGSVWVPGLSYVTTTLDLIASLGSPPGHGHVYGPEQEWRLPRPCG